MKNLTTLTGTSLTDAFKALDKQLPAAAYKKIEGGKGGKLGFTDIVPVYLPELLLELFGPIGVGWGFGISDMQTASKDVKRKGGYEETEHTATCKVTVWYAYKDGDTVHRSQPIEATGGSTNTLIEWAMKGAITNALGCAWFFAGYQWAVHKDERSHNKLQSEPQPEAKHPLVAKFEDLKLPKLKEAYFLYVGDKYKVSSINFLTEANIKEQMAILHQCGKNKEKKESFIAMLSKMTCSAGACAA